MVHLKAVYERPDIFHSDACSTYRVHIYMLLNASVPLQVHMTSLSARPNANYVCKGAHADGCRGEILSFKITYRLGHGVQVARAID